MRPDHLSGRLALRDGIASEESARCRGGFELLTSPRGMRNLAVGTVQGWARAGGPAHFGRCPTLRSAALSGPRRCVTVTWWTYHDADFRHAVLARFRPADLQSRQSRIDAKLDFANLEIFIFTWHLHGSRFACSMFCTMVLGPIQESATELLSTLQEARLRALEFVKDRRFLSTGRSGTWQTWSLEADSYKI